MKKCNPKNCSRLDETLRTTAIHCFKIQNLNPRIQEKNYKKGEEKLLSMEVAIARLLLNSRLIEKK